MLIANSKNQTTTIICAQTCHCAQFGESDDGIAMHKSNRSACLDMDLCVRHWSNWSWLSQRTIERTQVEIKRIECCLKFITKILHVTINLLFFTESCISPPDIFSALDRRWCACRRVRAIYLLIFFVFESIYCKHYHTSFLKRILSHLNLNPLRTRAVVTSWLIARDSILLAWFA